jgi:hypothetical protein
MVAQDAIRAADAVRARPDAGEALLQGEDLALRRMRYELNQAVERMRQAAEFYNQPLEFMVNKDKRTIKARDRRSGSSRELTLTEAEAWLAELEENKGKNLNGYA